MLAESLSSVLRAIAEGLRAPVMIILLVLIAVAVILAGMLIAEAVTERRRLKVKMPQLVDDIKNEKKDLPTTIRESGLLKRQKAALLELTAHSQLTAVMREALARRLLFEEQTHYDKVVKVTDVVARIAPMMGLLGTLIPLGPGLIALGQGDTYTLSSSLLMAFDTTIAGLAAAAVAFVVSAIRKSWYENYMTMLEALMECILDREAGDGEK